MTREEETVVAALAAVGFRLSAGRKDSGKASDATEYELAKISLKLAGDGMYEAAWELMAAAGRIRAMLEGTEREAGAQAPPSGRGARDAGEAPEGVPAESGGGPPGSLPAGAPEGEPADEGPEEPPESPGGEAPPAPGKGAGKTDEEIRDVLERHVMDDGLVYFAPGDPEYAPLVALANRTGYRIKPFVEAHGYRYGRQKAYGNRIRKENEARKENAGALESASADAPPGGKEAPHGGE